MITGIRELIIQVRDYRNAVEFYTKKLGMVLVTNDPSIDHYAVAPRGTKNPAITFSEDQNSSGGQTGITFSTDDLKATCQTLRENGVKVTEPFQAHGEWWAGFKDPDGNSYGLHQT